MVERRMLWIIAFSEFLAKKFLFTCNFKSSLDTGLI